MCSRVRLTDWVVRPHLTQHVFHLPALLSADTFQRMTSQHLPHTATSDTREELYGLNKIRREITSRPSYDTMLRWCNHGYKMPDGVVFLECKRIGKSVLTSHAAFDRFVQRTQRR